MSRTTAALTQRVMYHFTDKEGYNAIRAGVEWRFKIGRPPKRDPEHPPAAYFTTLGPCEPNLDRLRIPSGKRQYVFAFTDLGDLTPIRGGKGRYILFSNADYVVARVRQLPLLTGLSAEVESRQREASE